MTQAIATTTTEELAPVQQRTAQDVLDRVQLIQQVMQKVMKPSHHYMKIAGRDTLLKAGAEKLCATFQLSPTYAIVMRDLGDDGHREYEVTCDIRHISGSHEGQGVGSCNTKEKGKAGDGGSPADYYNNVLKMAKKRAFVDAVLTATAASDIFAQDLEDMDPRDLQPQRRAAAPTPAPTPVGNGNGNATVAVDLDAYGQAKEVDHAATFAELNRISKKYGGERALKLTGAGAAEVNAAMAAVISQGGAIANHDPMDAAEPAYVTPGPASADLDAVAEAVDDADEIPF